MIGWQSSLHFLIHRGGNQRPISHMLECSFNVFPAPGNGHINLHRILIGSLCCLRLLRLARVLTFVLLLRYSIENCSDVLQALLIKLFLLTNKTKLNLNYCLSNLLFEFLTDPSLPLPQYLAACFARSPTYPLSPATSGCSRQSNIGQDF